MLYFYLIKCGIMLCITNVLEMAFYSVCVNRVSRVFYESDLLAFVRIALGRGVVVYDISFFAIAASVRTAKAVPSNLNKRFIYIYLPIYSCNSRVFPPGSFMNTNLLPSQSVMKELVFNPS